ncbi:hypothetical protein FOMPIDRAFT_1056315 [Fomitopsis schrenkii]|uniref:Uncharacterized protein n=1 Tax=Fomitopsis schrenkii TaxID=2126942 RepID=S8DP17_FOMSC|nr:hypothetical protein FOMPIDRAFT_1056315 [Fomitopsis schrenkii]
MVPRTALRTTRKTSAARYGKQVALYLPPLRPRRAAAGSGAQPSAQDTASIFRVETRTFRKRWPFYDFLAAENVVVQYGNCFFSLHRLRSMGRTTEQDLLDGKWARMMQAMATQDGPFAWITSGKVDAVLDIKFPREPMDELQINALLGKLADAISTAASSVAASATPSSTLRSRRTAAHAEPLSLGLLLTGLTSPVPLHVVRQRQKHARGQGLGGP